MADEEPCDVCRERGVFHSSHPCDICGEEVGGFEEYQSFVGRYWRGHKDHTESEAAKFAMVRRADVLNLLNGTREQQDEAAGRLRETIGE